MTPLILFGVCAMMNSSDEHVSPIPYSVFDISNQYSKIGRVSIDPVFVSSIQCVVLLCRCPTVSRVRLISVHHAWNVVIEYRIQDEVVGWD